MLSSRITSTPSTSRSARTCTSASASTSILRSGRSWRTRAIAARNRARPLRDEEMIVFHQHHVVETEAMICSPTRDHRRFLKLPQAGRRLARVEDFRTVAAGGLDELMGQGRNAAQPLEEIERDAFGRENRARPTANFQDRHAGGHDRAVFLRNLDPKGGIDPPEDFRRHLRTGHDGPLLGDRPGGCLIVFGHEILARDVAAPISSRRARSRSRLSSSEKFMGRGAGTPAHVAHPDNCTMRRRMPAQQGRRYKKDPGRARGETFECENVPPPESP